jgi:hypothetical protein
MKKYQQIQMVMKYNLFRHLSVCGAALATVLAAGCATQSYGRMPELSESEQLTMSCETIAAELYRVSDYRKNVALQGTTTSGSDVIGFLTDFGASNSGEREGALSAADRRKRQLQALYAKKRCR